MNESAPVVEEANVALLPPSGAAYGPRRRLRHGLNGAAAVSAGAVVVGIEKDSARPTRRGGCSARSFRSIPAISKACQGVSRAASSTSSSSQTSSSTPMIRRRCCGATSRTSNGRAPTHLAPQPHGVERLAQDHHAELGYRHGEPGHLFSHREAAAS